MPIKYGPSNDGRMYGDTSVEDALLAGLRLGSQQGAAAFRASKAMEAEETFRQRQLGLQESIARAEAKNRDRLTAIAEAENKRAQENQPLVQGQLTAATKASEASTAASQAATNVSNLGLEAGKFEFGQAQDLAKRQAEERGLQGYITSSVANIQNKAPFALDFDTFSDDQLKDLDPVNAPTWISVRNEARKKVADVSGRLEGLRVGAGQEFLKRMQEADARADAAIREAMAKKKFGSLATDSSMVPQDPNMPTPMQSWYQQAQMDVQTGAKTYATAMSELAAKKEEAVGQATRLASRRSLHGSIASRIEYLTAQAASPRNEAEGERIQREIAALSGLSVQMAWDTDGKISDYSKQFGEIVKGQGELPIDQNTVTLFGKLNEGAMGGANAAGSQQAAELLLRQMPGMSGAFAPAAQAPATGGALQLALQGKAAEGGGPQGGGQQGAATFAPPPFDPYAAKGPAAAAPATNFVMAPPAPEPGKPLLEADVSGSPEAVPDVPMNDIEAAGYGTMYPMLSGIRDSVGVEQGAMDLLQQRYDKGERGVLITRQMRDQRTLLEASKRKSREASAALRKASTELNYLEGLGMDSKNKPTNLSYDTTDIRSVLSSYPKTQEEFKDMLGVLEESADMIEKEYHKSVSQSPEGGVTQKEVFRRRDVLRQQKKRLNSIINSIEEYGDAIGYGD